MADLVGMPKQCLNDPALTLKRIVRVEYGTDAAQDDEHLPEAELRQSSRYVGPGGYLAVKIMPGGANLKPLASRGLMWTCQPIG